MAAAVIAGLAVGVIFVVIFSYLFDSTSPIIQKRFHTDLSILGLKDSYLAGEEIDFAIRANGYINGLCSIDYPHVLIIREQDGQMIRDLTVSGYLSAMCDPGPLTIDRTWIYGKDPLNSNITGATDVQVTNPDDEPITLNASGKCRLQAVFRDATAEKVFDVISNDAGNGNKMSTPVKCQQLTLCTYQLKEGNSTYPINFRFNGTIENMIVDGPTETLTIFLRPEGSTYLQIAIPREVVDSRLGADLKSGPDTEFAVFLDEINVDANELPKEAREWTETLGISDNPYEYRILSIAIPEGTETVEIVGTMLI